MALERGFRRIVVVLSILLLGLGVALDALFMEPHATVRVTLRDGRQTDLERRGPREYLTDITALYYAIGDSRARESCRERPGQKVGGFTPLECPGDIVTAKVLRGPEYWWWTDSNVTKIAAGLVAFLWIVFYTVRWIVRGFARQ